MREETLIGPIQEKWLRSLEQHPERQMTSQLGRKQEDGSYKACCLGELGLIAGLCSFVANIITTNGIQQATASLSDVYQNVGLYDACGSHIHGERYNTDNSLSSLNDNGTSWPQIAAIIRANPKAYLKTPK